MTNKKSATGRRAAFELDSKAWLSSTRIALMTPAQEGAYIRLLCHAWDDKNCSLPDDDKQLAILSRLGEDWKENSPILKKCFVRHPTLNGRIINEKIYLQRKDLPPLPKEAKQLPLKEIPSSGIPDGLADAFNCDRFRAAWRAWVHHRIEIRKKLTPRAIELQVKDFNEIGLERSLVMISHTIKMGWTGLREPKDERQKSLPGVQPGLDLPPISRRQP